jgi:3-methylcrotonyl-CoA carboxylase alpha subunit
LPATGRLDHLAFPANARVDSGVRSGDSISPWYDPMIAKIIVHGPTRAIALAQLGRALAQTQVAGSVTNLAFLGALARHDGFRKGDVDTGLIERDLAALTRVPVASLVHSALAVLAAANLPMAAQTGFSLWAPLCCSLQLTHQAQTIMARIEVLGPNLAQVTLDGETVSATRGDKGWQVEGSPFTPVEVAAGKIYVFAPEGQFVFAPVDPLARDVVGAAAGNAALAPMPGLVKALFVQPGQTVAAGDRLAVLEAMKMEHSVTAARAGVVAEVLVQEGDQVEAGAALILLENDD